MSKKRGVCAVVLVAGMLCGPASEATDTTWLDIPLFLFLLVFVRHQQPSTNRDVVNEVFATSAELIQQHDHFKCVDSTTFDLMVCVLC